MSKNTVTIGADPEVFLENKSTGLFVPVCGLIGGTKEEPRELGLSTRGYYVQEDNVMLEYNIPPCSTPDQFMERIAIGLQACKALLPKNLRFSRQSTGYFPDECVESFPQAMVFGCSVDFDAYTGGLPHEAFPAEAFSTGSGHMRFAGGHVHIGYDNPGNVPPFVVASFCDALIGLWSVGKETDLRRRMFYGSPGRFRQTSYGIEYRTMSNFWVFDYAYEVGNLALTVGRLIAERSVAEIRTLHSEMPWADVRDCIAQDNARRAGEMHNDMMRLVGG